MLRSSTTLLKNPVNMKQGQGMFTHQLKRLLRKKHLHKYNWDALPMYDPRTLIHSNREVDHKTYVEKRDPHWDQNVHWVPDQTYEKIPVPAEFKDAYWWRDLQARRIQCPVDWVSNRMYSARRRQEFDFQDLAFRRKKVFTYDEAALNARRVRS